jgi:glycosyltransferase involved in cell wall biosynthesis
MRADRYVVLLSSYNGASFIRDQLDSILDQTLSPTLIVVRDDGSTDATWDIVQDIARAAPISAFAGPNLGPRDSFFSLLNECPAADVVFLADQDDVWYPDKMARAIEAISQLPAHRPALYCSRVDIVDCNLKKIGQSTNWPRPPTFGNALVENIAMGCTIAINRAALELFRSGGRPKYAIMHDWWLYLIVSAFGEVIYDRRPSMGYRVHDANVVGLSTGRLDIFKRKLSRQLRHSTIGLIADQATEFQIIYGNNLPVRARTSIEAVTSTHTLKGLFHFLSRREVRRQQFIDNLALRVLFALRSRAV